MRRASLVDDHNTSVAHLDDDDDCVTAENANEATVCNTGSSLAFLRSRGTDPDSRRSTRAAIVLSTKNVPWIDPTRRLLCRSTLLALSHCTAASVGSTASSVRSMPIDAPIHSNRSRHDKHGTDIGTDASPISHSPLAGGWSHPPPPSGADDSISAGRPFATSSATSCSSSSVAPTRAQ